jgi:RimJ/RimL family protein N-acetyltransferase
MAALEVEITAVRTEHAESLRVALDEVARERRFLALVEAPPMDAVVEFVRANTTQGVPYFVAVAGGEVVGACDVVPFGFEGFAHSGRLGMFLRREYRGRGIGGRLLERTLRDAWSKGFTRVELEVFSDNDAAIRLYEHAGFEHEGRKRRARVIDGSVQDLLVMAVVRA